MEATRNLTLITSVIPEVVTKLSQTSELSIDVCQICNGCGFEILPEGAKVCECRRKEIRARRLLKMPPHFQSVRLSEIKPDPRRHPKQAELLTAAKTNPLGNYFLAGKFGTGKTLIMWALYREAVEQDRRVVCCT